MTEKGKHLTIGLQIQTVYDEYSKKIWPAIVEFSRQMKVNLIIFPGESLKNPSYYTYQNNVIYDLITKDKIDALILSTSSLFNYIEPEEVSKFISKFKDIPIVSLSVPMPNIPSILIDNEKGIKEAMIHLIKEHKRNNIAFITGPKFNYESQCRLKAYREELLENGYSFNEDLVVEGDFSEVSGANAVKELLNKRKVHFDAIIASNDIMAIGAMKELIRQNIKIPQDVSVVGFDNILRCLSIFPNLASIQQPFYQMARLAVKTAIDLALGKKIEESVILPTFFIPRASCGCLLSSKQFLTEYIGTPEFTKHDAFTYHNEFILNKIRQFIQSVDYLGDNQERIIEKVNIIIDKLESTIKKNGNFETFLTYLAEALYEQIQKGINISFWENIFFLLREFTHKYYGDFKNINPFFSDIQSVINSNIRSQEIFQRIMIEYNELRLSLIHQIISSSLTIEEILINTVKNVPRYEMNSAFLFRYASPIKHFKGKSWKVPEYSWLICAFDSRKGKQLIKPTGEKFKTTLLIPDKWIDSERKTVFIVLPLYFLEEQYGYIFMELGTMDPYVYDFYRNLLSSAFYTAGVLEKRITAEKELKKALEELKIKTEEYRTLSENSPDIILRVNKELKLTYISPSITGFINEKPETLFGKPPLFFKKLGINIEEKISKVFTEKEKEEIEFSNAQRSFNLRLIPELDTQGNVISVLGIIRDVTELKKIEEKLFQMEKIQAIGELAGGIAHDFNNQLAVILGSADLLLQEENLNEDMKKLIQGIYNGATQASQLTDQLLAFARKGKFLNTEVNIHKIIQDVLSLISNTIGKTINITKSFNADTPRILGDPSQLQNAILNLCINAVDAMPEGGNLTVSTENKIIEKNFSSNFSFEVKPGTYVVVKVKDEGIGMTDEIKKHLFEPFFTTKEPGKGTGMGLPAVYGTVKNHKGAIEVESEAGKGTCFTLYFPVYQESKTEKEKTEALEKDDEVKKEKKEEKINKKGAFNILIVDDDENVRKITAEIIKSIGFTTYTCQDGMEAIKFIEESKTKIDLILLDMIMPGLSGEKTFWGIKAISPDIKIILVSGYSLNEQAQGLLNAGAIAFLQKPFTFQDLSQLVLSVLNKKE